MFKSAKDRAVAYAAMKTLERMLKENGEIPPGCSEDVSGYKITIILPPGSVVERDLGTNGDGTIYKTAVQNLYGYALWALLIERLRRFNQWKMIRDAIIDAMREVIRRPSKKLREEIIKEFPHVADEIEKMQAELQIPQRLEDTPRIFNVPPTPATVKITSGK